MADDWIKIPRIADGHRYEVNASGGVWKDGQDRRKGGLEYVRVKADGTDQSVAYRAMANAAGKYVAVCVGLFDKLLQIAAKQPLEKRWLILLSGNSRNSWDSGILADQLSFSRKDVDKALEVLSHEDVRWIEWGEWSPSLREFREFRESRELPLSDWLIDCHSTEGTTRKTVVDSAEPIPAPPEGIVYPPGMDTPKVRQAILDWIAHHRALGKPYKNPAHQIGLLLKKEGCDAPETFVAAVENSIGNNYQGLIPTGGTRGQAKRDTGQRHDPDRPISYGRKPK